MAAPKTEKELMQEWVENWRVVADETERLKTAALRALTEDESAAQFNELEVDPALLWQPEERRVSSGLIDQQRLFAQAHEPGLRRRA